MDLLIANLVYVAFRLFFTANIVRFFSQYMHYYWAVFIAAQFSFLYDNGVFAWFLEATELPQLSDLILADISYTIRVLAAWFVIKILWDKLKNYYLAVFIGAELTFIVDYFIFDGIVY